MGGHYLLSSIYTQSSGDKRGKRTPNPKKYLDWIAAGRLLYADLEQLPEWERKNKISISKYIQVIDKSGPSDSEESSNVIKVRYSERGCTQATNYIIKTEKELVKEREAYNNKLYQQSRGSITLPA